MMKLLLALIIVSFNVNASDVESIKCEFSGNDTDSREHYFIKDETIKISRIGNDAFPTVIGSSNFYTAEVFQSHNDLVVRLVSKRTGSQIESRAPLLPLKGRPIIQSNFSLKHGELFFGRITCTASELEV